MDTLFSYILEHAHGFPDVYEKHSSRICIHIACLQVCAVCMCPKQYLNLHGFN